MVGINTAKIAQTGFEGMGFALPANLVDDIVQRVMDKGRVTRPALGLFLRGRWTRISPPTISSTSIMASLFRRSQQPRRRRRSQGI